MQDVKLTADDSGLYGLTIENNQIASVEGFETTITVALMTDARAPSSLVPNAVQRRGWVGDILKAENGEYTGGHLWLLEQARLNSSTFSSARIYASDALNFLVENRNANGVNINIVPSERTIDVETEIVITENITERYNTLWRNTSGS